MAHEQLAQQVVITEPGYMYVYLSNEEQQPTEVYFDDFSVLVSEGPVIQINDYYPYGMVAYSWVREGEQETKEKFQGKEYESKTGLYDFHARQYDGAIGRFWAMDPANQFASGYVGMGNNPVVGIDPDGEWVHIVIGAVVGTVFNVATNWSNINSAGDFFKYAGIGAAGGAVGAATGNFALAGAIVGGGNTWAQGGNAQQIIMGAGIGAISGAIGGAAGGAVGRNLGGFAQGFVQGATGGATGGFVGGFLLGTYHTGDIGQGLQAGVRGAVIGGLTAGIAGGVINGLGTAFPGKNSGQDPRNFWSGNEIASGRGKFALNNTARGSITVGRPETIAFGDFESPGNSINQQDLTFNVGKQRNHIESTVQPGKSYLTTDQNILLSDLNSGNFTNVGVNHRGMPIVKFNHSIGNAINIQGVNLGPTPYAVIHINSAGQVHIVPWLPSK